MAILIYIFNNRVLSFSGNSIRDALRDLVPFVQFRKHPWRSATFSKVAG